MSLKQVGEVMNHAGVLFVPLIMTFRHVFNKKIISARFRRCIFGACFRRRERIILSLERDVVFEHSLYE